MTTTDWAWGVVRPQFSGCEVLVLLAIARQMDKTDEEVVQLLATEIADMTALSVRSVGSAIRFLTATGLLLKYSRWDPSTGARTSNAYAFQRVTS